MSTPPEDFSGADPTAIIVLAAGNAARMGSPKQLLKFRGVPLVRHAAETALDAGCGPVVVVLGANEAEVRSALVSLPVEVVVNERWAQGLGTSIRAGLERAAEQAVGGVILMLADQPLVTGEFLRGLVAAHRRTGKPIVASRYADTVGVPAFFAAGVLPLLGGLGPGQGCKGVILGHAERAMLIDCPQAATDVDTPADYARLIEEVG